MRRSVQRQDDDMKRQNDTFEKKKMMIRLSYLGRLFCDGFFRRWRSTRRWRRRLRTRRSSRKFDDWLRWRWRRGFRSCRSFGSHTIGTTTWLFIHRGARLFCFVCVREGSLFLLLLLVVVDALAKSEATTTKKLGAQKKLVIREGSPAFSSHDQNRVDR